jgi:ATP-binding cassette, subfamily B, bacterial HlyB/CyaB
MTSLERKLRQDQVVWLFGSVSALYRLPFDAALISQQFPPPYSTATVHQIARSIDLRTASYTRAAVDWSKLPLPALAFLKCAHPANDDPGAQPIFDADSTARNGVDGQDTTAEPASSDLILILRTEGETITYFQPGATVAETISAEDALARFEQELILIGKEPATTKAGEDNVSGCTTSKKEFGFGWFIPELLRHKNIWRDVLLASLFIQLVGLSTPLFTQVIIDKVIAHQTQNTLIVLGIGLVMFMLFTSAMTWLRQYLVLHTGNRIDAVLGSEVFRHLMRLPLPYFEQRPTGTLVARLQGAETIREFVSGAAVTLILDFPFLLIFLTVMFAYSWQLSLIAVGLLTVIAVMSALITPVLRAKINKQFMLGARNQAYLTEYLSGMATVKSLQMEPDVDRKYGDYLAQYLAAGFSTKQVGNTYNVAAGTVEQLMTLSILIFGALLVMQNDGFTIGMLIAFQMFASRMSQPMMRLVGLWQEFQQANIAVKRLGDILDMPMEPYAITPSRESGGKGRLDLANVAFRYSDYHPWLYRNLNIGFKPGHLSVLTGPSGCGKSTLAKLLLGFYHPTDGQIQLDGRDIRHLAANELRQTFGVVPQETVLFSGTIYDNLVMAHPHATFADVIEACKAAEIHDTLDKLPKGYQTEIGERGTGLSGGQRQRIAIARALLKKPKILIFDEAVSNLDQQTAEHFAKTINKLKGKVTMLFITHQIPKGLQVDEVFSFGGGGEVIPHQQKMIL